LAVLGSHDYSPAKRARILELSRRFVTPILISFSESRVFAPGGKKLD
jgi:hypothetical protein